MTEFSICLLTYECPHNSHGTGGNPRDSEQHHEEAVCSEGSRNCPSLSQLALKQIQALALIYRVTCNNLFLCCPLYTLVLTSRFDHHNLEARRFHTCQPVQTNMQDTQLSFEGHF